METDEMLRRYINDIRCYPRITAVREQELASIIQNATNDIDVLKAKDELVTSNLRLVVKIAVSYHSKVRMIDGVNVTVMDLIQAGNMGLMNAANKYSPDRNTKFVTYAFPSIQRWVKRVVKESRIIKIPVNSFYLLAQIKEIDASDSKMSDKDISDKLGASIDTIRILRKHKNPIVSDDLGVIIDRSDPDAIPLDDVLNQRELREYLLKKIDELKPMEKWTIFYRYLNNAELSLDQVGAKFGVTKERIRIAQLNGLKHLKKKIEEERNMKQIMKGGPNEYYKDRKSDNGIEKSKSNKNGKKKKV